MPITTPAPDPIAQNIESIAEFYDREEQKLTGAQRLVEAISNSLATPVFAGCIVGFVLFWVAVNLGVRPNGTTAFDPPPFHWLQGFAGICALLIMIVILIKQERLARFEEQRAHLDLQVNLLTEQKVTKLIHLMEELRRDLPSVKNRYDAEAEAMKQPTDPHRILADTDELIVAAAKIKQDEQSKP